tara:strand:+ start:610 stop:876 length:267 start_codon:yes stop_codon:yes gene_type:complete
MAAKEFRRANALSVTYRKAREGPPSYLVWEPHKSYICLTSSDVLKAVKWPKYTPTGAALREWMNEVEGVTVSALQPAPLTKIQGGLED